MPRILAAAQLSRWTAIGGSVNIFKFLPLTIAAWLGLVTNLAYGQAKVESREVLSAVYFTSELWPEEGRPRFKAKKDLPVFVKPSTRSNLIKGKRVKTGDEVKYSSTQFQTLVPAEIKLKRDISIVATDYGNKRYLSVENYYHSGRNMTLQLKQAKTIRVLQYRAEGDFLFEINSRIYGGRCDVCASANPKTAWWVRLINGGWVNIEEGSVHISREF